MAGAVCVQLAIHYSETEVLMLHLQAKVAAVLVWRKIGDRDAEILLAGTAPEHGGMRLVQQLVVELLKTQCVRCALHASSKAVSYWKEKHHFTAVKKGGCKWAKGRMFDPNVTGGLVMERARGSI